MDKIIGIDMARNIFLLHAVGSGGTVMLGRPAWPGCGLLRQARSLPDRPCGWCNVA